MWIILFDLFIASANTFDLHEIQQEFRMNGKNSDLTEPSSTNHKARIVQLSNAKQKIRENKRQSTKV